MAETRTKHEATFHLGWSAVVLTLALAAALAFPERRVLTWVLGIAAAGCAAGWVYMSGWRLRGPVWHLPVAVEPTPAEVERKEAARRARDALLQLFHARGKPAASKLQQILQVMATGMKAQADPLLTCGVFTEMYVLSEAQHAERELRAALEGVLWDDASESLRRFVADHDLDKKTASSYATDFYSYYSNYRLTLLILDGLLRLLPADEVITRDLTELRSLDRDLTTRLRDVIALQELAIIRQDVEELIGRWR